MSTLTLAIQCVLFVLALVGISTFLTFAAIFLVSVIVAVIEVIYNTLRRRG